MNAISNLPGWCSELKSSFLTSWIEEHQPKLIVEIGIYGGRSLIPMALAAKEYGGKVVGIDPWSLGACTVGMVKEENLAWWRDFSALQHVKQQFYKALSDLRLKDTVTVLEAMSDQVVNHFSDGAIGLLSIDGNHGPPAVEDGRLYLPKLAPGALVACDDTDWEEGGVFYVRQMIENLVGAGCAFLQNIDGCSMLRLTSPAVAGHRASHALESDLPETVLLPVPSA